MPPDPLDSVLHTVLAVATRCINQLQLFLAPSLARNPRSSLDFNGIH